MSFPTAPTDQQEVVVDGERFRWEAAGPAWRHLPVVGTAADVPFVNTGSGLAAADVQAAIREVQALAVTAAYPYLRTTGNVVHADITADITNGVIGVGDVIRTACYYEGSQFGGCTYRVVAGGTGTNDSGSFHTIGSVQLAAIFNGVVDPTQFGCRGDGVTDDRSRMQNAATVMSLGVHRTMVIPPGTYRLSTRVLFNGNRLRVYGIGRPTIWGDYNPTTTGLTTWLFNAGDNHVIEGIRFRRSDTGAHYDALYPITTLGNYSCVWLAGSEGSTIRDCETADCIVGIVASTSDGLTVDGLTSTGITGITQLKNYHVSLNIDACHGANVRGVHADSLGLLGTGVLAGGDSTALRVTGCRLRDLNDNGIYLSSVSEGVAMFNRVSGVTGSSGIKARGSDNIIAHNVIDGCIVGINATGRSTAVIDSTWGGERIVIEGNTITNSTSRAIVVDDQGTTQIYLKNVRIAGNLITNAVTNGTAVGGIEFTGDFATISGNIIDGSLTTGAAIRVYGLGNSPNPADVVIEANILAGVILGAGILVEDAARPAVRGNKSSAVLAGEWIVLTDVTDADVLDNHATDGVITESASGTGLLLRDNTNPGTNSIAGTAARAQTSASDPTVSAETGAYTLVASDLTVGKRIIRVDTQPAAIPTGVFTAARNGRSVIILNETGGAITLAGAGGVTLIGQATISDGQVIELVASNVDNEVVAVGGTA